MQTIDAGIFVVVIDERSVRVRCKENDVEAVVTAIGPGLSVYGAGDQAYSAHGRDCSLLVVNRLSMGMAPVVGLAPIKPILKALD